MHSKVLKFVRSRTLGRFAALQLAPFNTTLCLEKLTAPYFVLTALFVVVSCSSRNELVQQIEQQLISTKSEKIDLSKVGGNAWEKVCIFGPYSTNEAAEKGLGFKWNMESKTNIAGSDTINVIAFAAGSTVLSYTEYPRGQGDFSQLSGKCFERGNAVFVRDKNRSDFITFVHGC